MTSPFRFEGGAVIVGKASEPDGCIQVPGSKSLTNRMLLLAAQADGPSTLEGALDSQDTRYMAQALREMGTDISRTGNRWQVCTVQRHRPQRDLHIGNAGTAMRFLSPYLAAQPWDAVLTGNDRMLVRPIGDLVDGLRQLGARIDYLGRDGNPPLAFHGGLRGGRVCLKANLSSQFLSGLLMIAPGLAEDTEILLEGDLVSRTYVEMTLDCMRQVGLEFEHKGDLTRIQVPGGQIYAHGERTIEADASTASYWFGLPLMLGGRMRVGRFSSCSTQGDLDLLDHLEAMGARIERDEPWITVESSPLRGIDVDMNTTSDVAPTLAVIATRATTPTTIGRVGHMRIKECDRIATLQAGFDGLGLRMESGPDWMRIYPGKPTRPARLDPQDDHRMAMVFTLLGLAYGGVEIEQPGCVDKTYPDFYSEMDKVLSAARG